MNEEERRLRAKGWNDPPTYTFDQINQANQGMNVKATLPIHKRYKYPAPAPQGAGMPVGPGTAPVQQSYGPTGVASMSSSNPQAGPMDVGGAPLYSSVSPYGHPQAGYSNVPNVSQHGTAHSQYFNSGQAFPPEATMQPQQVTQQYQNYNTQQYQHYNTQQGNFQPHQ